jgi:hypothetical protein
MLPSQILLNNLLYDTSQLAIPTDNVDSEQLRKPSHWDIGFIRRFMVCFGPLSSAFDFVTFGVMVWVFHSGAAQFRSGWFVESLATQTLVIFAIRTRRVPFFRSHPSVPLALAVVGVALVGALLPATPLAHSLGFQPLPGDSSPRWLRWFWATSSSSRSARNSSIGRPGRLFRTVDSVDSTRGIGCDAVPIALAPPVLFPSARPHGRTSDARPENTASSTRSTDMTITALVTCSASHFLASRCERST